MQRPEIEPVLDRGGLSRSQKYVRPPKSTSFDSLRKCSNSERSSYLEIATCASALTAAELSSQLLITIAEVLFMLIVL